MDFFSRFVSAVGSLPEWVSVIICPSALLLAAVFLFLTGKRSAYPYAAAILGGAGFFLVACRGDASEASAWLGLFCAECALLRLIFLIPHKGRNNKGTKKSKEERIYDKFRAELSDPFTASAAQKKAPPKICCFEEEPSVGQSAEESGLRLSYVTQLLEKLRAEKLSAADRLETDVLLRSLDTYRNKRLNDEDMRALNDCLAVILKLTAKYRL